VANAQITKEKNSAKRPQEKASQTEDPTG